MSLHKVSKPLISQNEQEAMSLTVFYCCIICLNILDSVTAISSVLCHCFKEKSVAYSNFTLTGPK